MISTETQGGRWPRLIQAAVDAFSLPDLRYKILFTLGMLALYRFVSHIPIPGINTFQLNQLFENNQLLGFLDLFSGGALSRMSIVALGVFPYITASIVMQLLTPVIPSLQQLSREGEAGRVKINRMVHWLTVPIAVAQGFGQLILLQQSNVLTNVGFTGDALMPTMAAIISMTAGTMFLVWLGELITERGIGNGISLIIFAGIVAGFPGLITQGFLDRQDVLGIGFFVIIGVLIIALIVLFNEAHRRIPVQYGRSIFRGGRMYRQSGGTYIPLRINSAGMIPLIFAFSIVILPGTMATYFATSTGVVGDVARFFRGPVQSHIGGLLDNGVHPGGDIHLLLYAGGLPAAEPGGEPPAERRIRPGHQAGAADAGVPEPRDSEDYHGRRPLPGFRGNRSLPGVAGD